LLAESLKGNKTLKTLILNENVICSDGGYAVADLLLDSDFNLKELQIG
jgi:hypothetical protein